MAMAIARSDDQPLMELNTTPLIDMMLVLLVLLVMFIVTIPLQTHAVKIDIPPVEQKLPPPKVPDPVVNTLTVDRSGAIAWNGTTVDLGTLKIYLDRTRMMTPEPELHFQPDASARFDTIDRILATVKRSRISKFGFVGNERFYRYDH